MIFCIGNGKSREKIDLPFLKKRGIIYGSNALYRDFVPDKLVVTDPHMLNEVIASGYSKENEVITNIHSYNSSLNRIYTKDSIEDRKIKKDAYIKGHKIVTAPFDRIHPVNTGWVSIRMAYHSYPEHQIYMIGFDLFGDRKNIYDNTSNYPTIIDGKGDGIVDTEYYNVRIQAGLNVYHRQEDERIGLFYLLKEHFCPGIRLTRVIDDGTKIENIDNITTKQFFEEITSQ